MGKWQDTRRQWFRKWAIRVLGEEYETLRAKALARDAAAVQASLKEGECEELLRRLSDAEAEVEIVKSALEGVLNDRAGAVLTKEQEETIRMVRTCQSKQPFGSREAAEWAAVAFYRRDGRVLDVYCCPVCGQHHHTSTDRARGLLKKEITGDRAASSGMVKVSEVVSTVNGNG